MTALIFNELTKKYQVSKTLRFELVPTKTTKKLLKENSILEKDEQIAAHYSEIKLIFDDLHRKFVTESLDESNSINWSAFTKFAEHYHKKEFDALLNSKKEIWKAISDAFNKTAEQWKKRYAERDIKLKSEGHKILTEAEILKVLADEYPQKKTKINSFNKFFTYFDGFNEARENLYKNDGTPTAVATRITNNFILFLENINDFKNCYEGKRSQLKITKQQEDWFKIEAYKRLLLQRGIDMYNDTVGVLNQSMKELRDKHQKEQNFKKADYPLLRNLNNQILGKKEEKQFFDQIKDEDDAWNRLQELADKAYAKFNELKKLFDDLAQGVFTEEDEAGIYLTNKAINTLSRRFLTNWYDFQDELSQRIGKKGKKVAKDKHFVSLADIRFSLNKLTGEEVFKLKVPDEARNQDTFRKFLALLRHELDRLFNDRKQEDQILPGFNTAHEQLKQLLSSGNKKVKDEDNLKIIKNYFDAGQAIYSMGRYFSLASNDKKNMQLPVHINADFYNLYNKYAEEFNFSKQLDLFRNFITKKPGDKEKKIKLNFNRGNLLNGWAESPPGTAQFMGYIIRKEGTYYLGVTTDPHFLDLQKYQSELTPQNNDDVFEKLEYFQLDWAKNIVGGQVYSSYTQEQLGEKLSYKEHKQKINSPSEHVDFIKKLIRDRYASRYKFLNDFLDQNFANPEEMQNAFAELPTSGMKFVPVRSDRIKSQQFKSKNNIGYLYLFEIKNKDLAHKLLDKRENIHTMYWRALFSKENLKNLQIKLSGGAEIFLRRGKPDELKTKIIKGVEIRQHKRFAEDKLLFHVPIVLNASSSKSSNASDSKKSYDLVVRQVLAKNIEAVNVIGIDRGEKNLLYYSVINQKGEILEQASMNELELAGKTVNFYDKLKLLEKERRENRRSWMPVRQIKDLKKGYVSHAIYKVCQLIDKYQAIVVLEDLNMRFKQVRGGIERSVYQQFEKALIDKLNYLTFKDKSANQPGGVFCGYQLTAPFKSFDKLGKQTGILFYTQADYTSVTDPLTGFRKNIYISNSESIDKIRKLFIDQKIRIDWDSNTKSYTFVYHSGDFNKENNNKLQQKRWRLYANIPRIKRVYKNGYWQYELVNPNDMLNELFKTWGIKNPQEDVQNKLIKKLIKADKEGVFRNERKDFEGKERNFWQALIFIFNLVLQLRNSATQTQSTVKDEKGEPVTAPKEEVDFIASPVSPCLRTAFRWNGQDYPYYFGGFENRFVTKDKEKTLANFNGDANGAYNIARKGLIILKRIADDPENPDLYISNADWDKFTQSQWKNT